MIAKVQNQLGNSKEALADYKEAPAGFQKIGDRRSTAVIQMNLSSYYSDYGQYADALKSTQRSPHRLPRSGR